MGSLSFVALLLFSLDIRNWRRGKQRVRADLILNLSCIVRKRFER